MIENKLS